jgi:hypothetical protein
MKSQKEVIMERYKDGNLVDLGTIIAEVVEELKEIKEVIEEMRGKDE